MRVQSQHFFSGTPTQACESFFFGIEMGERDKGHLASILRAFC